jgi:hypothetical protein
MLIRRAPYCIHFNRLNYFSPTKGAAHCKHCAKRPYPHTTTPPLPMGTTRTDHYRDLSHTQRSKGGPKPDGNNRTHLRETLSTSGSECPALIHPIIGPCWTEIPIEVKGHPFEITSALQGSCAKPIEEQPADSDLRAKPKTINHVRNTFIRRGVLLPKTQICNRQEPERALELP